MAGLEKNLDVSESLCDLDYIKAEYEREKDVRHSADDRFCITLRIPGSDERSFEVRVNECAQFAAELDVLASLIRARLLKAQFDAENAR